jgi:phosphoglycolate phosphatase
VKYKLVIFDLDGTLIDSLEDLGEAVNHAMRLAGFPEHNLPEYRLMVGHGVRNLVTQALPPQFQADEPLIDRCLASFKEYYTSHIDVHTRPYPGMEKLLRDLHSAGVLLAVASNKFQSGTEYLVSTLFPGIPFVAILGNREGSPLKPDPEIVGEALRKAGITAADAVLVGDSLTDMKTAANGRVPGIAVPWGYRTLEPSADYILVTSPEDLRHNLL